MTLGSGTRTRVGQVDEWSIYEWRDGCLRGRILLEFITEMPSSEWFEIKLIST